MRTDSTAAKSITSKFGLGKQSKHIQLRFLYMQDLVRSGLLAIKHVRSENKSADVMTKYLSKDVILHHLSGLSISTEHRKDDYPDRLTVFHYIGDRNRTRYNFVCGIHHESTTSCTTALTSSRLLKRS